MKQLKNLKERLGCYYYSLNILHPDHSFPSVLFCSLSLPTPCLRIEQASQRQQPNTSQETTIVVRRALVCFPAARQLRPVITTQKICYLHHGLAH